jgi:hypothetical protein
MVFHDDMGSSQVDSSSLSLVLHSTSKSIVRHTSRSIKKKKKSSFIIKSINPSVDGSPVVADGGSISAIILPSSLILDDIPDDNIAVINTVVEDNSSSSAINNNMVLHEETPLSSDDNRNTVSILNHNAAAFLPSSVCLHSAIVDSLLPSSSSSMVGLVGPPLLHYSSRLPGPFSKSSVVQHFIQQMVSAKTFSLAGIKRAMLHYIHSRTTTSPSVSRDALLGILKPNGLHISEMFDEKLFQHGSSLLPVDSYPLKPSVMWNYHRSICNVCSLVTSGSWMDTSCYIKSMLLCITHGWHPPIDSANITPKYSTVGNYPTIDLYPESVSKEFEDMVSHGVVVPFYDFYSTPLSIINPLGAILKNSDKVRAKTQAGIVITDQSTLSQASNTLISMGFPKIKSRIITDVTATGINGAAYSPPFRYPSFHDGLRLISKNCYMGKTDVGRYFHSFPLALLVRSLFLISLFGRLYAYARCFFGFTSCPYYASTWSAEFRQWILPLVPNTVHMMDDWLTTGPTLPSVEANINMVEDMFRAVGFYIADDKREFGQRLTFLGVLIDSTTMTMSFDPIQVQSVLTLLTYCISQIRLRKLLPKSTIEHICGKLNWYSEVVQSGRLHLRSWWSYLRFGVNLTAALHSRLLADALWWSNLLQSWAQAGHHGVEYHILSASELLIDPHSIYIMQSDASGTDGFGYFSGYYEDTELQYVSKRWSNSRVHWSASDFSSHSDELEALADFLVNCSISNCLLVWITDSQSAAFSVLKGSCHEPRGFALVTSILHLCDLLHLELVALWVPREENELADYLSHLAVYLHREVVSGPLSSLATDASVDGHQQS